MKTFDVVIEGSTPILFDNPAGMSKPTPGKGAPKLTAQEQAERGCYWMSDKSSLMFPGDNLHAALKVVAPGYKYSGKRHSAPCRRQCGSGSGRNSLRH